MTRFLYVKIDKSKVWTLGYYNELSLELRLKLEDVIIKEGGSFSDLRFSFTEKYDEVILSFTHKKSAITNPEGLL